MRYQLRLQDFLSHQDLPGINIQDYQNLKYYCFNDQVIKQDDAYICFVDAHSNDASRAKLYINNAIKQKASFIIKDASVVLDCKLTSNNIISVANIKSLKSKIALFLYPKQPKFIVGITGTNGKTSVASFFFQILNKLQHKAACLGTLGMQTNVNIDDIDYANNTTPDPLILHEILYKLYQAKVNYVATEASSHGLMQNRLDNVCFHACAFTNLTAEHLDYHTNLSNYFAAKSQLFQQILPRNQMAILNADSNYYEKLAIICNNRDIKIISYGRHENADIRIINIISQKNQQEVTVKIAEQNYIFTLPVIGDFQVWNVLCAVGLLKSCGLDYLNTLPMIKYLANVPGRLELVADNPLFPKVFIDYAHTPDALQKTLATLRTTAQQKLVIVFGCGGNRDAKKRKVMAQIASQYTDTQIITDDNPRYEDPQAIRESLAQYCYNCYNIADRREAITTAIKNLKLGDICIIAGKGHEQYQIYKSDKLFFDDKQVALELLEKYFII